MNCAAEVSFWGRASPSSGQGRSARLGLSILLACMHAFMNNCMFNLFSMRNRNSTYWHIWQATSRQLHCTVCNITYLEIGRLLPAGGGGELKEIVKTVRFAGQEFEYAESDILSILQRCIPNALQSDDVSNGRMECSRRVHFSPGNTRPGKTVPDSISVSIYLSSG